MDHPRGITSTYQIQRTCIVAYIRSVFLLPETKSVVPKDVFLVLKNTPKFEIQLFRREIWTKKRLSVDHFHFADTNTTVCTRR